MITLFSILLTISVYLLTLYTAKRIRSPFTSPVFLSTILIIVVLTGANISYHEYLPAKDIMTFLLGPATVALAVPIYNNRKLIRVYLIPALVGLLVGTFTTIMIALLLAKWFHFSKSMILSISIKSVTVPVAAEIGQIIGGNPSLIVAFVIITGMFGAMFGPKLLNLLHVHHPFARGLSIGTISHGIGTAEAVREGEMQGAVAGASMGIAAILTSFIIPYLIPFFV
ncbi:LrgB family protein [Bacillus sp. EB600]|uniref:LrgB family protein n=1 Tax=Bacillus sp. EB600 TaxID=2806345 RepID=UPI00210C805D|nr:LrgB family protein [Bacillus sp. EB600]MCQ6277730.1 LrgB family protein [Bacillus sp. EB600]